MNHAYFNRILHLLEQRPQQGKRLIGLGATAFWELWQRVEELDKSAQQQRAERSDRQRQSGGGMKKSASVVSRLLVWLLYMRQHWTMQALAETVSCSEATVWNYIHEMLPYIRQALPASLLEHKLNQDFNRALSQQRVYGEHVIRVIKTFRVAKDSSCQRKVSYAYSDVREAHRLCVRFSPSAGAVCLKSQG